MIIKESWSHWWLEYIFWDYLPGAVVEIRNISVLDRSIKHILHSHLPYISQRHAPGYSLFERWSQEEVKNGNDEVGIDIRKVNVCGWWIAQSCQTLWDPTDSSPPGSSVHGDSPSKNTGVGCHALLQGNLLNPGIKPRSPKLQADSLPSEPPGKPKKTGVGSLSLLQGNFPTQESNRGLLHCRRILYWLSY